MVARIGKIVQSVRQPVPLCLDRLRFQRRWTLAEVRLGQGTSAAGLTIRVDKDKTSGIHVLQDRATCGYVRSKEAHKTGTSVDEELRDTSLESDRLPAGLATVPNQHRDVQVTARSSSPRSRRPGKNRAKRVGEAVTHETSSLVDDIWGHASQGSSNLAQRPLRFPTHGRYER
ncbi:hypothetical protein SUDANB37_05725 [Streptomyces sp. enrichment culture]